MTDVLASFLPRERLDWLVRPEPPVRPRSDQVLGSVLFVDVSGFTRLTERLSRLGARGSEQLSEIVDACFGRMTSRVGELGGDVIAYAGDAMLAMWPAASERELERATCLAAQAALRAQADQAIGEDVASEALRLRASVACGPLDLVEVGGVDGRWQYLVSGTPLAAVFEADARAGPGDVTLAPAAARLLGARCVGSDLPDGHLRLTDIARPIFPEVRTRPAIPAHRVEDIRACVPGFIGSRIEAGHTDWLAEFRTISVVFVTLREADDRTADSGDGLHQAVDGLQDAVAATQQAIESADGFVYQALVDDKGMSLVAAFGLPSQAYENDAARAVRSAMSAQAGLIDLGWTSSAGVATGLAFTGIYGTDDRRQYTLVGSVMNRGARLAQAAAGGILCDAATRSAASRRGGAAFVAGDPLVLKGIEDPVPSWRPMARRPSTPTGGADSPPDRALIGRIRERAALDEAVEALMSGSGGGLVVIEGEAGIGKSRLAAYAMSRAAAAGARCLAGEGQQIGQHSLYHAWRPVYEDLLGIVADIDADEADPARWRAASGRLFLEDSDLRDLAPLLSAVLPFDLPDTERTAAMPPEARADATHDLLAGLLGDASKSTPTALLIEDLHWLDSASLALLAAVVEKASGLLVVASARPMGSEAPPVRRWLHEAAEPRRLVLGAMEETESVALVRDCLAVDRVPEEVTSLVHRRAQGNPFFSEQLTLALRDYGIIRIDDDACTVAGDTPDLARLLDEHLSRRGLPGTLQGVVSSRVDRLDPNQQLTVKLASVIGPRFETEALASVHPHRVGAAELAAWLNDLVRLKITVPDDTGREGAFAFRHAILRDVVYNSLTFGQRTDTHTAVAEWLERDDGGAEVRNFPVLAHHWSRAGAHGKAKGYLAGAGDDALERYANEEAVRFFEQAIAIDETAVDDTTPGHVRAAWELQLGAAYVNWSRYREARKHLAAGLVLEGHRAPGSPVSDGFDLAGQMVRQVVHRLASGRYVGRRRAAASELQRIARAYESLVEAFYLENATVPCLLSAVRSLNFAELGGPSAELARGYASFGAILGFVPAHGLADRYFERALRTADETGDVSARAWVGLAAGVYKIGVGAWEEAEAHLGETREVAERLGDRRRWDDAMQNLAALDYLLGRYQRSLAGARELHASAGERRDERGLSVALRREALCQLATNELAELAARTDELDAYVTGTGDLYRDLPPLGLKAQLHLRQRRHREAAEAISAALAIMRGSTPTFHDSLSDFVNVAQASLSLHRMSALGEIGDLPDLPAMSRDACKALRRFARVFPIGRPYSLLCDGVRLQVAKKPRKAAARWEESIRASTELGLIHCEGLARLELGCHLLADGAGGREHLERALTIFEGLGAEYETTRARTMLPDV